MAISASKVLHVRRHPNPDKGTPYTSFMVRHTLFLDPNTYIEQYHHWWSLQWRLDMCLTAMCLRTSSSQLWGHGTQVMVSHSQDVRLLDRYTHHHHWWSWTNVPTYMCPTVMCFNEATWGVLVRILTFGDLYICLTSHVSHYICLTWLDTSSGMSYSSIQTSVHRQQTDLTSPPSGGAVCQYGGEGQTARYLSLGRTYVGTTIGGFVRGCLQRSDMPVTASLWRRSSVDGYNFPRIPST